MMHAMARGAIWVLDHLYFQRSAVSGALTVTEVWVVVEPPGDRDHCQYIATIIVIVLIIIIVLESSPSSLSTSLLSPSSAPHHHLTTGVT